MANPIKEKTVVINHEPRLVQIPFGHESLARESGRPFGRVDLKPGTNLVDAEEWAECEKLESVRLWKQTITSNRDIEGARPMMLEVIAGLPALDAREAERVLREVYDVTQLDRWLKEEKREDIRVLIRARADEIARIVRAAKEEEALKKSKDKRD